VVTRDEQPLPQPRGQKSWAVLARVALADHAVWRSELAEELFATADDPLGALRWSLADIRRSLGRSRLLRNDPLSISRGELDVDVWSLADGTLPADELGTSLLTGIELRDCPEFDLWLLLARSRWQARSMEELRGQVLRSLACGSTSAAVALAERGAALDSLDESAQELLLRALVADGQPGLAAVHLAACAGNFAREGLSMSPALRAAGQDNRRRPSSGLRAGVAARSLLQAGTAALDAGAADGGVETLRRAAEDAARASEPALLAEVLRALGSALVHSVRGFDGEGAVVLHRALLAAREAGRPAISVAILRELAFIDVQAGRHFSANRAVQAAKRESAALTDPAVDAAILAIDGMNEADQGHHDRAMMLLGESAELAEGAGRGRQLAWSLGVQARSLLLGGAVARAQAVAEASIDAVQSQRWNAFLPWPQAIRAECLSIQGRQDEARAEAEQAFVLGCELGDPCWEGMAARTVAMIASRQGEHETAWQWVSDARRRSDRVIDHYVWVSCYIGVAQVEIARRARPDLLSSLARQLQADAIRFDLPDFVR
jgi:DNA-binding SARP family transcriptional activator